MKKATVKSFNGVFANPKPVLVVILSAAMICVLSCIVGTGYADVDGGVSLVDAAVTKADPPYVWREGAGEQPGEWHGVRMRVTAYCPCPKCCGKYSDGKTACGYKIRRGDTFVAADKKYSFGTEMVIEGYNNGEPVKVLDRGGAIGGNRLDVFFASHEEALKWGVRYIEVKVRRQ